MKIEFIANGDGGERDEFPVWVDTLKSNAAFRMYIRANNHLYFYLSHINIGFATSFSLRFIILNILGSVCEIVQSHFV